MSWAICKRDFIHPKMEPIKNRPSLKKSLQANFGVKIKSIYNLIFLQIDSTLTTHIIQKY